MDFVFLLFLSMSSIVLKSATMAASTTHIVSFLNQKKLKSRFEKSAENLDPDGSTGGIDGRDKVLSAFNILRERMMNTSISNYIDDGSAMNAVIPTENLNHSKHLTDDAPNKYLNTLENSTELFDNNHISLQPTSGQSNHSISTWGIRVKQSIPVLEPVRHLLNTVRDGSLNDTSSSAMMMTHHTPHSKHPHQLVGSLDGSSDKGNGTSGMHHHHNDSTVIETEEEREMVNESPSFHFLELLGMAAGRVWAFFTNIQKFFAASSGSASAASSSSSSDLNQ